MQTGGWRAKGCGWILGVSWAGLTGIALQGCGIGESPAPSEADEGPVRAQDQAVTAPTVTVTLPAAGSLAATPVAANGSLVVADRAWVKSTSGAYQPLYNNGSTLTDIGVGTTTGSLTSRASVLLRNNARVQGNLVTAGTLTKQAGAVVTQTTTQRAALPPPVTVTWEVPLTSTPSQPKNVAGGSSSTIAPGSFGKLTVNNSATAVLSSGTYAFSDLQLEPDGILQLNIDPALGPVILYLDALSAFRGRVLTNGPDAAESLLVVHRGSTTMRLEKSAPMAIVAPNATVQLSTGGVTHRGTIFAKGISLDPDVKMTYVPFKYWDWVDPVWPYASCLMPSGRGKLTAVFGYENKTSVTQTIPLGSSNVLTPPGPSGVTLPTQFLSGLQDQQLWVPMSGDSQSWTLRGKTVTVTKSGTPICEMPSLPVGDEPAVISEGRPYPRANIPPMPAPYKKPIALKNGAGPGVFAPQVTSPPPGGGGTSTPVSQGKTPLGGTLCGVAQPAADVTVPIWMGAAGPFGVCEQWDPGTFSQTQLDFRFNIDALSSPVDSVDMTAYRQVNGVGLPETPLTAHSGNRYPHSWSYQVPAQGISTVHYGIVEHGITDEVINVDFSIDPAAGSWSATATSSLWFGVLSVVAGLPLWLGGGGPVGLPQTTTLSNQLPSLWNGVDFPDGNFLFWGIDATPIADPPLPGPVGAAQRTEVCVNWPAYFYDEALPSQDNIQEEFVGQPMDAAAPSSRVRRYPAGFAKYSLRARSFWGWEMKSGYLDANGCIPGGGLATAALVHDPSVNDGSTGGVDFELHIEATFADEAGVALGKVTMPDVDGNEFAYKKDFRLTSFSDEAGWTLDAEGWAFPPATITLSPEEYDAGSTTAAVASHMAKRFTEEGIAMPSGGIWFRVDDGVDVGTKDYLGNYVGDSAYDDLYNFMHVGPGFIPCKDTSAAPPCEPRACVVDGDCPGGQYCSLADDAGQGCGGANGCLCAWPHQSASKFTTTHELAHFVQTQTLGRYEDTDYLFACPGGVCPSGQRTNGTGIINDPPFMDPICGCEHVGAANSMHCLQSIERIHAAHLEGFAQFFSSLMWNSPNKGTCRFNYYKEMLDEDPSGTALEACRVRAPDGTPDPIACRASNLLGATPSTVSLPPVVVDCNSPTKWRNKNRCGVDSDLGPEALDKSTMATEYDWMTFLFEMNRQFGFTELMQLHVAACRVTDYDRNDASQTCVLPSKGAPISWQDAILEVFPGQSAGVQHGGILSGAQRRFGALDQRTLDVESGGLKHGIDQHTEP